MRVGGRMVSDPARTVTASLRETRPRHRASCARHARHSGRHAALAPARCPFRLVASFSQGKRQTTGLDELGARPARVPALPCLGLRSSRARPDTALASRPERARSWAHRALSQYAKGKRVSVPSEVAGRRGRLDGSLPATAEETVHVHAQTVRDDAHQLLRVRALAARQDRGWLARLARFAHLVLVTGRRDSSWRRRDNRSRGSASRSHAAGSPRSTSSPIPPAGELEGTVLDGWGSELDRGSVAAGARGPTRIARVARSKPSPASSTGCPFL